MNYVSKRARAHAYVSLALAAVITLLVGGVLLAVALHWRHWAWWGAVGLTPLVGYAAFARLHRKYLRRKRAYREPFPENWRGLLQHYVPYYQYLSPALKLRFEKQVQLLLAEIKFVSVGGEVDDPFRVLTAACAVIPVFSYEDWEYDLLSAIYVRPHAFGLENNMHAPTGNGHVAGLVGNERLYHAMVLSRPDVLRTFVQPGDGRNVALHEFVHLIDKADGGIDGVPYMFLGRKRAAEWRTLRTQIIEAIRSGNSILDPYAGANEAEFFAVAAEYFFETPSLLYHEYPELYALMRVAFRQDTYKLLRTAPQDARYHEWKLMRERAMTPPPAPQTAPNE